VAQYAHDVTTFLMWRRTRAWRKRKRVGLQVFVFLILFAFLMYFTKEKRSGQRALSWPGKFANSEKPLRGFFVGPVIAEPTGRANRAR